MKNGAFWVRKLMFLRRKTQQANNRDHWRQQNPNRSNVSAFQHRLKSSQREKAREFAILTQTGEKTALFCLAQHDWKLDVALDNYFASPEVYFREPKAVIDRKKLESTYAKYRGNLRLLISRLIKEGWALRQTGRSKEGSKPGVQISRVLTCITKFVLVASQLLCTAVLVIKTNQMQPKLGFNF